MYLKKNILNTLNHCSRDQVRLPLVIAVVNFQLILIFLFFRENFSFNILSTYQQRRLLTAAKELADATAKMVEAAKSCASNPSDRESQEALKRAADNLKNITQSAVGTTIKRKMIKRLENASKHAAATATQCIAASQGAGGYNNNSRSQDELMDTCKGVADVIPRLVEGVKMSMQSPDRYGFKLVVTNDNF